MQLEKQCLTEFRFVENFLTGKKDLNCSNGSMASVFTVSQ